MLPADIPVQASSVPVQIIIRLSIAASVIIMAGYSLYIIIKPSGDKALVEQEKSGEEIPASPDVIADTNFVSDSELESESEREQPAKTEFVKKKDYSSNKDKNDDSN